MSIDLEACLDRVLAGETAAYADIVRAYQPELMRIVALTWHCMAGESGGFRGVEDLVQQVFVDAFLKLDTYARGSNFGAWIRTIARNWVRQEIRAWNRENRRLAVYRRHLLIQLADDATHDEYDEAYHTALRRCLQKLPDKIARVLELRYRETLSFQQIAERVSSTAEAIRKVVSRSQIQLRNCIESQMG